MEFLPNFQNGDLEHVFHDLKQSLSTLAEDSAPMEDYIGAIHTAISKLGTDNLTGDMRAPSPPKKPSAKKAAEPAMAAVLPVRGGGKSKGKGPAAKPTAEVTPPIPAAQTERGPCLAGDQCPFFGTEDPCVQSHTPSEMDTMRKALGPRFVNANDRRNRQIRKVEAAQRMTPIRDANNAAAEDAAFARAIAEVLQAQGPPVAAQPASAATTLSDKLDRAKVLFRQLKAAQAADPQDGSVPSGAAVTLVPHIAMCSVGRVPAKEPSSSIDAIIQPGHAPGQPSPTIKPTTVNNFYIIMPIAESPPVAAAASNAAAGTQAKRVASVQQSVSIPQADVIATILCQLAPVVPSGDLCFGDFPACTAVLPPSDRCKTGAAQGSTCAGVTIDSPETGGRHAATDDLDGWADDAPWSPGRALRPCDYHRLQQANSASASYSRERMQPHCFQCPYSLPQHTADGSRSCRFSSFKCPCGRK
jgi:hypothetical protein